MRNLVLVAVLGLYGCVGSRQSTPAVGATTREYILRQGDTLWTIAERRYGRPGYCVLVAHHNDLLLDTYPVGARLQLPAIDEMVHAMSALAEHRGILDDLLRGRTLFCAAAPQLRALRDGVPPGTDRAVPDDIARSLNIALELLQSASDGLERLRANGDAYPESLHKSLQQTMAEIRIHATGRYRGHRLPVRQTEFMLAYVFRDVPTWQKCLSGELPPESLKEPDAFCGGTGE